MVKRGGWQGGRGQEVVGRLGWLRTFEHGIDQIIQQLSQVFRLDFIGHGLGPLLILVYQTSRLIEHAGRLVQLAHAGQRGHVERSLRRDPQQFFAFRVAQTFQCQGPQDGRAAGQHVAGGQ